MPYLAWSMTGTKTNMQRSILLSLQTERLKKKLCSGFGAAPNKSEGNAVNFDDANEAFTARYNNETIALAFSITEEAIEDNLYDRLGSRYTRALARSMAHTKQVKAASILNNAFTGGASAGGDGVALCSTAHPLTNGGTLSNTPAVASDF